MGYPYLEVVKRKAEREAKVLGHEIGDWIHEPDHWREHYANCKLCSDYVYISDGCRIKGTAVEARPVRSRTSSGFAYVKDRCSGVKLRAEFRRKYTLHKKRILKSYKQGGVEKVIIDVLGYYPQGDFMEEQNPDNIYRTGERHLDSLIDCRAAA